MFSFSKLLKSFKTKNTKYHIEGVFNDQQSYIKQQMQQFQLLHAEQQQQYLQLDSKLAEKMDQIDQDIKSQGNFIYY